MSTNENKNPTYTAGVVQNGKFGVKTVGPCGDLHILGDVRSFDTFEEADQVAREIAAGKYPSIAQHGDYFSMR